MADTKTGSILGQLRGWGPGGIVAIASGRCICLPLDCCISRYHVAHMHLGNSDEQDELGTPTLGQTARKA